MEKVKERKEWYPDAEKIQELKAEYKELGLVYYTPIEELLNAITHGIGVLLGLVAMIMMIKKSPTPNIIALGIIIFVGCLVLYTNSALYHSIRNNLKLKRYVRKSDHASVILVVIACGVGITLATEPSVYNYVALSLSLAIAVANYVGCFVNFKVFNTVSFVSNFVVGVLFLVAYIINSAKIPFEAKMWYLAGVIFCIAGSIMYKIKKPFIHTIFHVITIIGPAFCLVAEYLMI